MDKNQLSFDWFFTYNKLPKEFSTEDPEENWNRLQVFWDESLDFENDIQYIVAQQEFAPTTGHEHYHVYVQFRRRVKPGHFGAVLGRRWTRVEPHIDKPTSAAGIIEYCKSDYKSDPDKPEYTCLYDFYERGQWVGDRSGQGKRSDLARAAARLAEGANISEIAVEQPATFIRNFRGMAISYVA